MTCVRKFKPDDMVWTAVRKKIECECCKNEIMFLHNIEKVKINRYYRWDTEKYFIDGGIFPRTVFKTKKEANSFFKKDLKIRPGKLCRNCSEYMSSKVNAIKKACLILATENHKCPIGGCEECNGMLERRAECWEKILV